MAAQRFDDWYMRKYSFSYYICIEENFSVIRYENYGVLTKKQVAKAQAAAIPEVMLTYGKQRNGDYIEWQARGGLRLTGCINLLPVPKIYAPLTPNDFYIYDKGADLRLHDFRPVDIFKSDACVGLLHDERRSPRLYYFRERGSPRLIPLEVDIQGYMNLLQLSLGFMNWQSLLVELASPWGQARPFTLEADTVDCNTLRLVLPDFKKAYPAFSLEAFVARYDQVRLP